MKYSPVKGLIGHVAASSGGSLLTGLADNPVSSSIGHSVQPSSTNSSNNSPVSGSIPQSKPVEGSI